MMYDLDDATRTSFEQLYRLFLKFSDCSSVWHIGAQGRVYDKKYHAGANQVVSRKNVSIDVHDPPYVKSNISPIRVPVGNRSLYLFPDRILIFDGIDVGAIAYSELHLDINPTRFIEDGRVPRDAGIVGSTWRFVNKDGGPDERFNNNRQLPICLYEEIHLNSSSGLNEILQVSRTGFGENIQASIRRMVETIEAVHEAEKNRQKEIGARQQVASEMRDNRTIAANSPRIPAHTIQPSLEELCSSLLRILCCVIVADGRASKSERQCIYELLQQVKSPWDVAEIDKRVNAFIDEVRLAGFKQTVQKSLLCVPMFKQIGKQHVLVHCIDVIAAKGEPLDERERFLCDHLKQMVM